ncbi:hypothetical protein CQ476_24 [TM7 phage DolZOral124_53_65]|nr:hypothetical protein CQ476_24 [TM7 phage DolZOral124_53_65]
MVDNQRAATMRERLGERASALVPHDSWLPRSRAVQKMVEPDEFDAMVEMAHHAKKPAHYWARIIAKDRIESTLKYVRRLLKRSVEAMSYVARKIGNRSKSYMNYVGDKIAEGKYPMNQVVNMVELSIRKKHPDRYLIGILKKGYEHAAPQLRHQMD